MNLLRYRAVDRTVRVGGRKVKVSISDNQIVQHVEDGDVLHATVRPAPIGVRTSFQADLDTGLWVPLGGK